MNTNPCIEISLDTSISWRDHMFQQLYRQTSQGEDKIIREAITKFLEREPTETDLKSFSFERREGDHKTQYLCFCNVRIGQIDREIIMDGSKCKATVTYKSFS